MGGIRGHHFDSPLPGAVQGVCQTELVIPLEEFVVVLHETIVVVPNDVRRVCKDEVAIYGLLDEHLKVSDPELRSPQQLGSRQKVIGIHYNCCFLTLRNIELAVEIDTVHTVEAGAVQI
jgi:hypothetical protein